MQELAPGTNDSEHGLAVQYPQPSLFRLSEKLYSVSRLTRKAIGILPMVNGPSALPNNLAEYQSEASISGPDRYVCVCFPGITYKKFLHHVDVNRAADDPQLFFALQRKYFDWKPLWRRIMTLRTLARVEYFEVSRNISLLY